MDKVSISSGITHGQTHIVRDGGGKSENKAREGSIDGRCKNRYEGRQTNNYSRKKIEPNGEPPVHCTKHREVQKNAIHASYAHLPTSNSTG
jgi:hypothetical protein